MNSWIQCYGLFKREVSRYIKVPLQTIAGPIVSVLLYLLIFGINLGEVIHLSENISYLGFLIPGLSALSIIRNSFDNSTSSIMGAKYSHELQDLRVTPLSIHHIILAKGAASLTRGLWVGLLSFSIGELFFFLSSGTWLPILHVLALFYFVIFGSLTFSFLGIAVGMYSKSFEHTMSVSGLILLPLIYLGGVFFTLDTLPLFWQKVSYFNPVFYIIHGIRYSFLGLDYVNTTLAQLFTLSFLILTYLWAYVSLKSGTRYL